MKIRIYLKAFSKEAMNDGMEILISHIISLKNIKFYSVALPTRIKKFCVLRSPHVNKDSREEFEIRIFKRFLDINCDTIKELMPIFENFCFPAGVACFFSIINN
jgi:small subunit ribosomal protein S10